MNHKEYLELLSEDLNMIFRSEQGVYLMPQREREHYFRVKILIFHLHADYLLSEIIRKKFQENLISEQNKDKFEPNDMEFMEKLRIFHATNMDEGIFTALKILNKVRNNLSHNLIIDLTSEQQRIKSLQVSPIIRSEDISKLTPLEHLLYGTLTYINVLAEYLHRDLLNEQIDWILSLNIPQFKETTATYHIFSVVQRIAREAI